MIMCTSVYQQCLEPFPMPTLYNSHYECMMAGYEEAIKKAKEIGPKEINEYKIYFKFDCILVDPIVPPPKPKVPTTSELTT